MTDPLFELKFPIGPFNFKSGSSDKQKAEWIRTIENFPSKLEAAIASMTKEELEVPYRPQGWNSRQVVHHCADSHMNSFIRLKLTLTEEKPAIRPYFEDRWAELPDSKIPVDVSLALLKALHERWAILLRTLEEDDWAKTYYHPEHGTVFTLEEYLANYAWHCEHHLGHIGLVRGV